MASTISTLPVQGQDYTIRMHRRRYGQHVTFTWVDVLVSEDTWASLGDPWPCITPAKAEIAAAILLVVAGQAAPEQHETDDEEGR